MLEIVNATYTSDIVGCDEHLYEAEEPVRDELGEQRHFTDSERHWRAGYADLEWIARTANAIKWKANNSYDVATNAMRGCLLDENYTDAEELLSAPWPVDERRHNLPIELGHVSEREISEMGEVQPMSRATYRQLYGTTCDLVDPQQWMINLRSLRDHYLKFKVSIESVSDQRADGLIVENQPAEPLFLIDNYGDDEQFLFATLIAMAHIDESF